MKYFLPFSPSCQCKKKCLLSSDHHDFIENMSVFPLVIFKNFLSDFSVLQFQFQVPSYGFVFIFFQTQNKLSNLEFITPVVKSFSDYAFVCCDQSSIIESDISLILCGISLFSLSSSGPSAYSESAWTLQTTYIINYFVSQFFILYFLDCQCFLILSFFIVIYLKQKGSLMSEFIKLF